MEDEYIACSFTGKALKRIHVHYDSITNKTEQELYTYTYDNADRLLQTTHQLNGGSVVTLASNDYDELCRLKTQKINNDTVNYTYNLRNWLTNISSGLFTETLGYETQSYQDAPANYNGNITFMEWQEKGDIKRKYFFTYDATNKLTYAQYGRGDTNQYFVDHSVGYGYDKMGNLVFLQRNGGEGANWVELDYLNLKYDGNQLINAKDWFNDEDDPKEGDAFVDYSLPQFIDKNNDGVEYTYDANGNMTSDYNKEITEIKYNSLNLLQVIQFQNGNAIYYTYDAMGEKLKTEYYTIKSAVQIPMGSIMPYTQLKALSYETTRAYCGRLIYENDVPSTWQIDNGYVSLDDSKYHFYFTDHEGNTRSVVNQDGTVEQVNNYYPYGLSYAKDTKTTANRFKYNDKELETMHSLDWYDYGARFYDPELCQWHTVDPLAEKYFSVSPYAYCFNNPIRLIDLDGRIPTVAEAAAMAAHVYGDKTNGILTGGWHVSNRDFGIRKNDVNNGLQSQVYERPTVNGKREYTYVTAGTQDLKDAVQDVVQVAGLSTQYSESVGNAKSLSQELRKSNQELTFVGHSLGGGEAALNALATNNNAITFNAAGVSDITKAVIGGSALVNKSESKINAVVMSTDPLNAVQKSLGLPIANGKITTIYPKDLKSVVNGHSMDNVLKNYNINSRKYIKNVRQ